MVLAQWGEEAAEDRDEYTAESIFWVPPEARWSVLQAQARQPTIGTAVDDAMTAIERDNPALKDVLPKDYARPALGQDSPRPGDRPGEQHQGRRCRGPAPRTSWAASTSTSWSSSLWPRAARAASSTPRAASCGSWWKCSSPTKAASTTPAAALRACSSSPSSSFRPTPPATATPAPDVDLRRPNSSRCLHLRPGVQLHHLAHGPHEPGDPRHRRPDRPRRQLPQRPPPRLARRLHPRQSALQRLRLGRRAVAGRPALALRRPAQGQRQLRLGPALPAPPGAPRPAGFVLANGSMSSNQSGEGQIRKNIVEAGLVDCIVALPGQLFRSTQIPACLWFLARDGSGAEKRDETLFIDARNLGHMIDRTRRDLATDDIARISRGLSQPGREKKALDAYHRCPRLLQERHALRRDPQARPRPHPRPLRRRSALRKTTANPSRRRWPASPPNGASSRPKHAGWTPPSRRTWRGWGLVRVKAAVPKVREAIQLIERDGWRLIRTRGSHRQFKHPVKSGRVTSSRQAR